MASPRTLRFLPDNAILDDNGNYWTPTSTDEDGVQTFQPLRSGDDHMLRPAVYTPFYQDAEGNFSTQKGDDAITAEDFEAGAVGATASRRCGGGQCRW